MKDIIILVKHCIPAIAIAEDGSISTHSKMRCSCSLKTPECGKTEPEIFAEDQDIREKSEVHYEISAGG